MDQDSTKPKRRGLAFFAKALILGIGAVIAIAIAGDDELRASIKAKMQGGPGSA